MLRWYIGALQTINSFPFAFWCDLSGYFCCSMPVHYGRAKKKTAEHDLVDSRLMCVSNLTYGLYGNIMRDRHKNAKCLMDVFIVRTQSDRLCGELTLWRSLFSPSLWNNSLSAKQIWRHIWKRCLSFSLKHMHCCLFLNKMNVCTISSKYPFVRWWGQKFPTQQMDRANKISPTIPNEFHASSKNRFDAYKTVHNVCQCAIAVDNSYVLVDSELHALSRLFRQQ